MRAAPALLSCLLLAPLAAGGATMHDAWDGSTPTVACAGVFLVPRGGCPHLEAGNASWMRLPDGAARVSGVLTFEPRTPAQQVMHVFIQGNPDEPRPPVAYRQFTGSRVVAFDVDLTQLAGEWYSLSIHGDYRGAGNQYGGAVAEVAQPFHVEMDVTLAGP